MSENRCQYMTLIKHIPCNCQADWIYTSKILRSGKTRAIEKRYCQNHKDVLVKYGGEPNKYFRIS